MDKMLFCNFTSSAICIINSSVRLHLTTHDAINFFIKFIIHRHSVIFYPSVSSVPQPSQNPSPSFVHRSWIFCFFSIYCSSNSRYSHLRRGAADRMSNESRTSAQGHCLRRITNCYFSQFFILHQCTCEMTSSQFQSSASLPSWDNFMQICMLA